MNTYTTISDYYRRELFPYAIEYGMTSEEFWEGDPSLFWSYRISYLNKKKEEQEIQNTMMWIQGAYFYDAISKAMSNAFSKNKKYTYIEKPFKFGGEEQNKEKAEEKFKNQNSFWASYKSRLTDAQK